MRLTPERRKQIVARLVRHAGRDLSQYVATQEDVAALLAELDAVRAERDVMLMDLLRRHPALLPLYRDDLHVRAALDAADRAGLTAEAALAFALAHVAEVRAKTTEMLEAEVANRPPAPVIIPR